MIVCRYQFSLSMVQWILTLSSSEMGPYTELFRDGSLHWALQRWVLTELFRDGSLHWALQRWVLTLSASEMGPYWVFQRWVLTLSSSEMGPYTELFRYGSWHWALQRWVLTLSFSGMGPYWALQRWVLTELFRDGSILSSSEMGLFRDFYLSNYSWLDLPEGWRDVWCSDWFTCLQANKFDGSNVTVIQRTYTQPFDVKIFHPLRQPKGTLDDQTSNG